MNHPRCILLEFMIIAVYTTIRGVFHRIELLCSVLNGRLVYKPIIQAGYYVLEGPHPSMTVDTFDVIIKPCLGFLPRYMAVSAMRSRSCSSPVKWLIFNHRSSECSQPSNCSMSSSPEYFSGRGTRNDEGLIPLNAVLSGILTCSSINR